jgi:serpin B
MSRWAVLGLAVVLTSSIQSRGEVPGDAKAAATANNQFGLDLYARLRQQEGNLFFSPYSLSTAMAMVYTGAAGTTADQMARTLHWFGADGADRPWSASRLSHSMAALAKTQGQRAGEGKIEWVVANRLWGQKDFAFKADFLQALETGFCGGLEKVDFVADSEAARGAINTWVENQTHKRITDLIPQGVLDRTTRLVLANAVYFKADWASPFVKDRTKPRPFSLPSGGTPEVQLMTQTGPFPYAEPNDLQVLEMPYGGEGLSMVILLPRRLADLDKVERALPTQMAGWLQDMKTHQVLVFVPRFKLTCQVSLAETFKSMGMAEAFSGQADLSAMAEGRDLSLSAVLHKAFVSVDEQGTEAAAATGAVVQLTSMAPTKPVVFCANHPFIFLIRDRVSGAILFMGRFSEPVSARTS